MDKLQQGWITSTNQEDKIVNILIFKGRSDQLTRTSDYDHFFASPSSSSLSSSDVDEDDSYDDEKNGSCGSSNGPLCELSELLLQLPIKRGLSKYYQGKSQSFRNLGNVKTIKEFAKEYSSNRKGRSRTKKSYTTTPKHIICKNSTSSLPYLPSFSRR